jgi:hypothetical protein
MAPTKPITRRVTNVKVRDIVQPLAPKTRPTPKVRRLDPLKTRRVARPAQGTGGNAGAP